MLELTVNLDERSYPIYIGQSALQETGRLREHIGDCRPIIITNDTIAPLYLDDVMTSSHGGGRGQGEGDVPRARVRQNQTVVR